MFLVFNFCFYFLLIYYTDNNSNPTPNCLIREKGGGYILNPLRRAARHSRRVSVAQESCSTTAAPHRHM